MLRSFLEVHPTSHFPLQNLPYGVFRPRHKQSAQPRVGVAIGDYVLDLAALAEAKLFKGEALKGGNCFGKDSLNEFMALGRQAWTEARQTLTTLLSAEVSGTLYFRSTRERAHSGMSQSHNELIITIPLAGSSSPRRYRLKREGTISHGKW
eukprot:1181272-Prorocentrum_minimum.AAC.6